MLSERDNTGKRTRRTGKMGKAKGVNRKRQLMTGVSPLVIKLNPAKTQLLLIYMECRLHGENVSAEQQLINT